MSRTTQIKNEQSTQRERYRAEKARPAAPTIIPADPGWYALRIGNYYRDQRPPVIAWEFGPDGAGHGLVLINEDDCGHSAVKPIKRDFLLGYFHDTYKPEGPQDHERAD